MGVMDKSYRIGCGEAVQPSATSPIVDAGGRKSEAGVAIAMTIAAAGLSGIPQAGVAATGGAEA
jgi:hypothetical protein